MQNGGIVYFKATKNNIIVMLDSQADFREIKEALEFKATDARKFFGKTNAYIIFRGREISLAQEKELVEIIENQTELNVYVVDDNAKENTPRRNLAETSIRGLNNSPLGELSPKNVDISTIKPKAYEAAMLEPAMHKAAALEAATLEPAALETGSRNDAKAKTPPPKSRRLFRRDEPEKNNIAHRTIDKPIEPSAPPTLAYGEAFSNQYDDKSVFHKGSLRSGMCIESEGSVVVLGDVNPGGEIIAGGNIVVLGSLKGLAHAGAYGDKQAYVAAISFQPVQLRIANIITTVAGDYYASQKNILSKPAYAYIDEDKIYISSLS